MSIVHHHIKLCKSWLFILIGCQLYIPMTLRILSSFSFTELCYPLPEKEYICWRLAKECGFRKSCWYLFYFLVLGFSVMFKRFFQHHSVEFSRFYFQRASKDKKMVEEILFSNIGLRMFSLYKYGNVHI